MVILLVFDQFRGDYLTRWQDLFGRGGFRRLTEGGAWFQNCHYPFACTFTGPGHASLSTGQPPCVHGIVSNAWFDGEDGFVNCVQDTAQGAGPTDLNTITPNNLKAKTVGDVLHEAQPSAKVISLSLKDRSAVLLAGKDSSHYCSWHISDPPKGDQVQSLGKFFLHYHYHQSPDWLRTVDAGVYWQSDKHWTPLYDRNQLLYERRCTVIKDVDEPRFDHSIRPSGAPETIPEPAAAPVALKSYYTALHYSPFGNELLLQAIKKTIENGGLNKDGTNLLLVSFSSNDLVGHVWGPDSPEVLDMTLRTDRLLAELFTFLDEKVGKDQYLVCLSADHGVCPRPGVLREQGKLSQRFLPTDLLARASEHLNKLYAEKAPAHSILGLETAENRKMWDRYFEGWIYLSQDWKENRVEASEQLAAWLRADPDLFAAYSARQVQEELKAIKEHTGPSVDPVLRQVALGYFKDRCGDVVVVPREYCFFATPVENERRQKPGDLAMTTTHGTPHAYDTHVPLLVYGPGVQSGPRKDRTSPLSAAAIMAHALNIKMPEGTEPCPDGLFEAYQE
jgi:predicted AlkP superfamily pyrophosphatase or phosphodiesterase